jgi:RHS repeat-associated protein
MDIKLWTFMSKFLAVYTYDLWGQMETQEDARGEQARFEYDKLGRVTERSVWVSSAWQTVAEFRYDTYTGDPTVTFPNAIGRQTEMRSYHDGSLLAFDLVKYDALGRAIYTSRSVDVDGTGMSVSSGGVVIADYTFETSSTFDSIGRLITQTLPNPDLGGTTPNLSVETLTFSYNARGLFESVSSNRVSDQYVELTDYTATGGIAQQRMGNDVIYDPSYDATTDRMTSLYLGQVPGELLNLTYTYDNMGNIMSIADDVRDERSEFTYDHLDRLTAADICTGTIGSACSAGGQTLTEQRDYAYNQIGNITSYTYNNGSALNYAYSGSNAGLHAATGYNGWTYTYDANGNMLTRGNGSVSWTHTFDKENRLATVSDGTTTTSYVYDASGGRLMRRVGTTTTLYVMGMEIDLIVRLGGSPSHSWNKTTLYYPQSGAFRVVESADAAYSNTELFYRHGDHLGSTSVISNAAGTKVTGSDTTYAPFGETRGGTSLSTLTDFGYTGQTLDRSTGGLMDYNARFYLPELRRFISADTIIPGEGNSQALNRYAYTFNNPVRYVDPTGHVPVCDPDTWECTATSDLPVPKNNDTGGGIAECWYTDTCSGTGAVQSTPPSLPDETSLDDLNDSIEGLQDTIYPDVLVDDNLLDPCNWKNPIGTNCNNMRAAKTIILNRKEVLEMPDGRRIWVGALTYYGAMRVSEALLLTEGYRLVTSAFSYGGNTGFRIRGGEIGNENFRVNPLGDPTTSNPYGRLPHYHERTIDPTTGKTIPGGGIGTHRPWEDIAKFLEGIFKP